MSHAVKRQHLVLAKRPRPRLPGCLCPGPDASFVRTHHPWSARAGCQLAWSGSRTAFLVCPAEHRQRGHSGADQQRHLKIQCIARASNIIPAGVERGGRSRSGNGRIPEAAWLTPIAGGAPPGGLQSGSYLLAHVSMIRSRRPARSGTSASSGRCEGRDLPLLTTCSAPGGSGSATALGFSRPDPT